MSINYAWIITQMDCVPNLDGEQDFVVSVHWIYTAIDGQYYSDMFDIQKFVKNPEQTDFIPYAELKESDVIGWLENSLDVVDMQEKLANSINNLINPPIISPPLPWIKQQSDIIEPEIESPAV